MKFVKIAAVFVAAAACAPAFGADGSLILDEIVVKGQKESPREESLTIREVRESPARDIGEALQQVEGVSYVRKGAIANDVVLRGFQRDNINVLVDGVRVHGACPNRMDSPAFHYDFAEVEQVAIVKGPYDLENAGGLGGQVNATTKEPRKGFGADLSATYGSWDALNGSVGLSYGGESADAQLGYALKYSGVPEAGNGRKITDIYGATSMNRYRPDTIDSKAYLMNTGWTKLGFRPTDNSRTELMYSYQDADHVLYPYLKMDADYDRTHLLNWSYRIDGITPVVREGKLQIYWDRVSHLMNDSFRASSLGLPRSYSMQTDATTETVGVKAGTTLALGGGNLKSGIDYYNRNWDATNTMRNATTGMYGDTAMIPDVSIDNIGVFTEYDHPLGEKFRLKGGIRGDLTWARANRNNPVSQNDATADFGEVTGNLQLSYLPTEGVELFTGLARGSRPPDPQELFVYIPGANNRVGNPNLDNTVNHEADLGMKFFTERFYINTTLFYSRLSDYINLVQGTTAGSRTYANVSASMWGAEVGSQVYLPANFFLRGSFTYTEGKNRTADTPLSEIPPLRGMVSGRYDDGKFFVELAENMAARQSRVDPALSELKTAGWASTDLKAGFTLHSISLFAGINNLFDRLYYSHLSYQRDPYATGVKVPENGRYFYLTLQYRL